MCARKTVINTDSKTLWKASPDEIGQLSHCKRLCPFVGLFMSNLNNEAI